jgi:hypothetical protein
MSPTKSEFTPLNNIYTVIIIISFQLTAVQVMLFMLTCKQEIEFLEHPLKVVFIHLYEFN